VITISPKPITIVGGGLAGLTLGIGLRQRDVPVTLYEAGNYPRHRVCGEFISGRGLVTLANLGLQEPLRRAGAVNAKTAAFYTATRNTKPRPLPAPATCISRFVLDAWLAAEFVRLDGKLLTHARQPDADWREGTVRATGRQLNHRQDDEPWFGLKIHARKVALAADLEMHVSASGYIGLCQLENDEINVCGLFRKRRGESSGSPNVREWLLGEPGSPLRKRLAYAEFDASSFCAVAGISLQPKRAFPRQEMCLGDAITMIPPVTGNGMSMAFESAEIALEPLANWSRGKLSWTEAQHQIARECDAAFRRRLSWAKWLQRFILTPSLQNPLVSLANRSDWFWRLAFDKTR
jgi:flavin-dependent dehydrogenase